MRYSKGDERSLSGVFGHCNKGTMAMRWIKKGTWKAGFTIAGVLLLLILMVWVPVSVVGAHEIASGFAVPITVKVQATPTVDPTMTELQKEQLRQEIQQLKEQNDATVTASNKEKLQNENNWLWNNAATILTSFISTLALAAAGVFTVVRYFNDRRDTRKEQETEDQRLADDRKAEREKRAEGRFQLVVRGLGNRQVEAQVGAAIMLRTFLGPDYGQFYRQVFDLAVAHLRLPTRADPRTPDSPSSLNHALTAIFKESFRLTRNQLRQEADTFNPESLDATGIHLAGAHLCGADLKDIWMPRARAGGADFTGAELSDANLEGADLTKARLRMTTLIRASLMRSILTGAVLEGAVLEGADLERADLTRARLAKAVLTGGVNFTGADLTGADLTGADLTGSHPEAAQSLKDTKMCGIIGLSDANQRAACEKKGALFTDCARSSHQQSALNTS